MHLIWPSCHSPFDLLREKWSPFPSNWETHSNWVLQSLSLNLLRLYLVLETWVLAAGGQIRKTEASAQRDTEMRRSPRSPPGVLVPACPPLLSLPRPRSFPLGDVASLMQQGPLDKPPLPADFPPSLWLGEPVCSDSALNDPLSSRVKSWQLGSKGCSLFVAFFILSSTTARTQKGVSLEESRVSTSIRISYSLRGWNVKWNELFSSVNQSGSYLRKTKIQIPLLLPERCMMLVHLLNFSELAFLDKTIWWDFWRWSERLGTEQVHWERAVSLAVCVSCVWLFVTP